MLGIPNPTPYDLRFTFLGIPVRIHPLFWIISAVLGWESSVQGVAIWVACVLVSILVHEYGHGLSARMLGFPASIVLHGMGGLCFSDGERQSPGQRLLVLICGPMAGFALAGVAFAALLGLGLGEVAIHPLAAQALSILVAINLFWNVLNLMPVWPLDGGQITAVLLGMLSPGHGRRWAHVISLLTAGVLALVSYMVFHSIFMAIFFGMFAASNYQILQVLHAQARYGSFEGDDDWWRR